MINNHLLTALFGCTLVRWVPQVLLQMPRRISRIDNSVGNLSEYVKSVIAIVIISYYKTYGCLIRICSLLTSKLSPGSETPSSSSSVSEGLSSKLSSSAKPLRRWAWLFSATSFVSMFSVSSHSPIQVFKLPWDHHKSLANRFSQSGILG